MRFGLIILMMMSNMAFAQLFRLNVSNCGGLSGTPSSGDCGNFTQALESEVNNNFPSVPDLSELSENMENSSVVSSKGSQSSDYTNEIDIIQVGIGTGIAAELGDGSISDVADDFTTLGGFGVSPSLSVGLNPTFLPIDKIGFVEVKKLRLFGNFFAFDIDQKDENANYAMKITSLGFRARYHLFEGAGVSSLLKWGGVHVTTGYQYHKMSLNAEANVNETVTEPGSGASGDIDGTASLSGDITTHSIPIEISTYAQLGYVFSVYGGLATDISFGKGEFKFDVDTTVSNVSGAGAYAATGLLNIDGDGGPSALLFRAFAGIQLNVPVFKLYLQVQKTISQNIFGANVGFKLNW